MDEDPGDAGQLPGLPQQHALLEERGVAEVVGADADEGQPGVIDPGAVGAGRAVGLVRDDSVLPCAPVGRGLRPDGRIRVLHQPVERGGHLEAVLRLGCDRLEAFERGRQVLLDAPVEPVELRPPAHRHAHEDDLGDAFGMLLGVGEDQRRAPRPAHEQPFLDPEVLAQPLHVVDQVLRGVDRHVGGRVRGVRRGGAAAALVEAEPPVAVRIETAPPGVALAGTGPAVHDQGRLAGGVAELFPVDRVAVADLEHAEGAGFDRRVAVVLSHRGSLPIYLVRP